MAGEQVFEQWLHGNRGMTKTDMGWAAGADAVAEGTDATEHSQGLVDKALAEVRQAQAEHLERVRSRTAPGDHSRRVGIARAHLAAEDHAAKVRQDAEVATEDRAFVLESKLWGSGGRIPTAHESGRRRQARLDIADIEDAGTALDLYKRARRDGDRLLQQALFEKAAIHERAAGGAPWAPVIREHVKHNPQAGHDLAELRSLARGKQTSLAAQARWYVAPPAELEGLSRYQIEQLAREPLAD